MWEEVREMWGCMYEVLENVGEVWESVLGVGSVGKHGEVCLGCGKCVGVGRGKKCGQRWGGVGRC